MNDFLQALRASQAERQKTPLTRKSYDDAYYNNLPQYQYVNQSVPPYQKVPAETNDAADDDKMRSAVERLNDGISKMTDQQEKLIRAQERTADMLERQVISLEKILDHLKM